MKLNSFIFLSIILIIISCGSNKEFGRINEVNNPLLNIKLSNYDLYVFKMCGEYINDLEGSNEKLFFPKYTNCNKDYNKRVVEETYLFLPNSKENDTAIYLTTFSHLYTQKDCGVFNCTEYRDKIFVEDIDKLYVGRKTANSILFKNREKETEWVFDTLNENIEIVSITDLEREEEKQINLDSVLSLPIKFKPEIRKFTYGKSLFNEDCTCPGIDEVTSIYKNRGDTITNILVDSGHFYFENKVSIDSSEYFKFDIKRMPFYLE